MKVLLLTTAIAMGSSSLGNASPSNENPGVGTDIVTNEMNVGKPGILSEVDSEIYVSMLETEDGSMVFAPSSLTLKAGNTVRFLVENHGELTHEFILDRPEINALHKQLMASRSETHFGENAITLAPGKTGELIWKFTDEGTLEFACLIAGHYESGMFGQIAVN